jgi:alanine racemase
MEAWSVMSRVLAGPSIRPTRVEVDLGAVVSNARVISEMAPASKVIAVVKADAYGHGAVAVSRALVGGVHGFGVSLVEEGIELREAGIAEPVLVMGPAFKGGREALWRYRLTPMVSTLAELDALLQASPPKGFEIHMKVDTGMGRLGILPSDLSGAIARAEPRLHVAGISTHFACADTDQPGHDSHTASQLRCFESVVKTELARGRLIHAANSSAIFSFPSSHLDAVRPGLALYGAGLAGADERFRQSMSLVSEIAQLRAVDSGSTVSYGALWRAQRPSRLAVIPVGYADGYPRSLTGRAEVLIRGERMPVVGAISMDMTVADVTDLGDAAVGDEVVLLGSQGSQHISTAEFSSRANISDYEVSCGISKRVPRMYR